MPDTRAIDISSAFRCRSGWGRLTKKKTFGYTPSGCHRIATTPSRWKSVLKTVCTSSSSTTNQSMPLPSAAPQLNILIIGQVPPKGCHRWEDLFPAGPDKDQTHGVVHHSSRDNRSSAEPVQRIRDDYKVRDYGRGTRERYDILAGKSLCGRVIRRCQGKRFRYDCSLVVLISPPLSET